jgi:peptidoglycan/LPS O-acetylase OafA/YrhL
MKALFPSVDGPLSGAVNFRAGAGYMPGLDGLRAVSILIVLIAHLGFEKIVPGGLGVTIFFFVSGFLITRILVGEQNKADGDIDLKGFYIRRFLRLMPALAVFLLASWAIAAPFSGQPSLGQVLAASFYFINYYTSLSDALNWPPLIIPWGHLWSLAVEEHFYLVFPLALLVFGKTHAARLRLIVAAIVASAFWRVFVITQLGWSGDYTYGATECRLESIAWGCLLAVMLDGAPREKAKIRWLVGWPMVIIGLTALLLTLIFRDETFRATWRYSVQGSALFILILNFYALRSARFAIDLMEIKPLRWIGRLSYSLYLWHWPLVWIAYHGHGLEIGTGDLLPLPVIGLVLIASFAAASASYYWVERPLFELRKKYGGTPVESLART